MLEQGTQRADLQLVQCNKGQRGPEKNPGAPSNCSTRRGAAFRNVSSQRRLLLQNYTKTLLGLMEALPPGVLVCLPFTGDYHEGMIEKPSYLV